MDGVVFVLFYTIGFVVTDESNLLPAVACILVVEFPALGHAEVAVVVVEVEPIDAGRSDGLGLVKLVGDGDGFAILEPPVVIGLRSVARTLGLPLVVHTPCPFLFGGRDGRILLDGSAEDERTGTAGDGRLGSDACGLLACCNPDLHLVGTTVVPGGIGDEFHGDVGECAVLLNLLGCCLERHHATEKVFFKTWGECCALGNDLVEDDAVLLVHTFEAIDDGATLYGEFAKVVFGIRVGFDLANVHGKFERNLVAGLPVTNDGEISVLAAEGRLDLLSVDHDDVGICLVGEVVEVGGNGSILRPAGDAQTKGEVVCRFGIHFECDGTLPGIIGGLLDADLAAFGLYLCLALDVEVHVDVVGLCSIHVKGNAGNETGDVAWAAGASEPGLTLMFAHRFERIVVEELVARKRNARDDTIV